MKEIRLKYIRFLNFKSFRDKRIDFSDSTEIRGRNATGKTTVFDGFTWCLFGKDSADRKQFNVKTLDGGGVAIPKLPHEVECGLDVDGEKITVCRRYKEKWLGAGSSSERFIGHEEERLYNGVPMSVMEFRDRISAIIDEEMFKYITNPRYFASQKPETQRCLLFRMAGGLTDADIAARDGRFLSLLRDMGSRTMDEYRRKTKADLSRVTKEKEDIPARIDERRRDASGPEDKAALESGLYALGVELSIVEDAIRDKARAITEAGKAREEAAREAAGLKRRLSERALDVESGIMREYHKAVAEKAAKERELDAATEEALYYKKKIRSLDELAAGEEKERAALLNEYKDISAETLSFSDSEFVCPACGRMFEAEDIEERKRGMTARFNAEKTRRVNANVEKGRKTAARIEELRSEKAAVERLLEEKESAAAGLRDEIASMNPEKPECGKAIASDEEYVRISGELEKANARLESMPEAVADGELQERRREISLRIEETKSRIAKCEMTEANKKRIAELETLLRETSEEEIRLRGVLDTIAEFGKTRSRMLGEKVNGLFSIVRFRLFETQVNGEEKETCEVTVDGVPYSDVNAAGKTIAGLDIIAAMQRFAGVSAPIFIDNAEGISGYPESVTGRLGQVIRLRVTDDEELVTI